MLIKAVFIWSKSIFAINRQTTIFVAASPRGKKKKKITNCHSPRYNYCILFMHLHTREQISLQYRNIVDAIALAYASEYLQCPIGVRAHSKRGMASSWAWSSRISISEMCAAASWSSPSAFARFDNLDVPALYVRVLSV